MLPRKVFFFFLAVLGLRCYTGPSLAASRGHSTCGGQALPLRREASHGFSGCRARALGHAGSVTVAPGL